MQSNSDSAVDMSVMSNPPIVCGICLDEFAPELMYVLKECHCSFCNSCISKYFQFMIDNGHLRIYCPSFKCCLLNNKIDGEEICSLISEAHVEKYQVLSGNKVLNDYLTQNQSKIRCPSCDHLFDVEVQEKNELESTTTTKTKTTTYNKESSLNRNIPVKCPDCLQWFCVACQLKMSSEQTNHNCNDLSESILDELDIKKCPNCNYLIQREGGCAQISCRNCSHVFCWHCLKSLDNDFLLFHYDSGPCKNKLGHSRISIFFNRVQTISICLGISILMILASPVILMTLPCLLTSRCRTCCRRHKESQV